MVLWKCLTGNTETRRYFSLERYYCSHGRYTNVLVYPDAAKEQIDSNLERTQYMELLETISEVRKEITDCMEG